MQMANIFLHPGNILLIGCLTVGLIVFLFMWRATRPQKGQLLLTFYSSTFKIKGVIMALTLRLSQQASGQVNPVDKNGQPAAVEAGTVNYSTSNATVAEIVEDPNDETKFTVVAKGVGTAEITVEADADLGDGVKTITTFAAVEVFPNEAVGFGITFGEPEEQPVTEA